MTFQPQISVVLSTYQRPEHLRRSLLSLSLQRGVDGQFEVVVADDGSADETAGIVNQFARSSKFPIGFTTHKRRGYWLARCRNEGTQASRAPYLLFSDADCIFPPDHLFQHLRIRMPGVAYSGDFLRLNEEATTRLDREAIIARTYRAWITKQEWWRVYQRRLKDSFYEAIGHPFKPKLKGCNIALWRSDLERVNGFDEQFVGWGCEDDDLAQRLRRTGVRIVSMLGHTRVYHMWHPFDPTQATTWSGGANVPHLLRRDKPTRCEVGLSSHGAGLPAMHFSQDHSGGGGGASSQLPVTSGIAQ